MADGLLTVRSLGSLCGHAVPAGAAERDRRAGPAAGPAPHGDRAGLGTGPGMARGRGAGRGDRPPLGVQQSTVLRRLGPARVQAELALEDAAADPGPAAAASREDQPPGPEPQAVPRPEEQEPVPPALVPRSEPGVVPPRSSSPAGPAERSAVFSRYAGAMLLHAYPGRAADILPQAAGGDARQAALLSAVSTCFALGAATAEQVKHLAPAEAGAGRAGNAAVAAVAAPGAGRYAAPPTRWYCRRHSPRRCSPRTRRPPRCSSWSTSSSPSPFPNLSR